MPPRQKVISEIMSRVDHKRLRGKGSHTGRALGEHGEREAERLVAQGLAVLGMEDVPLKELRKGNAWKVALATLLRKRTGVTTSGWPSAFTWATTAPLVA
jgi:hypothetical protein